MPCEHARPVRAAPMDIAEPMSGCAPASVPSNQPHMGKSAFLFDPQCFRQSKLLQDVSEFYD